MHAQLVLIGRYELVEPIGEGGMSEVWRARDLVLDRDVAVKIMSVRDGDPDREAIRAEALAIARLNHPHIANVYDYGEAEVAPGDRVPFVVMELVRGTPLSAATGLRPRQALRVCAEVADALATAHAAGIVHRDIKPDNVMLTAGGAKVLDFGIAAGVGTVAEPARDEIVGTPSYLAPEALLGSPVTAASDVYALGVVLFGLLAHELPWSARTEAELVAAHLVEEPADLPSIEGVPASVAKLCRRCLARNPLERPTAAEVAEALTALGTIPLPRSAGGAPGTTDEDAPATTDGWAPVGGTVGAAAHRASTGRGRGPHLAMALAVATAAGTGAVVAIFLSPPSPGAAPPPGAVGRSSAAPVPALGSSGPTPGLATTTTTTTSPTATTRPRTSTTAPGPLLSGSPAGSPTTPADHTHTFVSAGGSIVADCYQNQAYLLWWEAATGYHVTRVVQGPAELVSVSFRGVNGAVVMTVTCQSGQPVLSIG